MENGENGPTGHLAVQLVEEETKEWSGNVTTHLRPMVANIALVQNQPAKSATLMFVQSVR